MNRLLERKPLIAAEKRAKPAAVCVTGGASYIACSVVARLLAAGHTVRATYRPSAATKPIVSALDALPGAAERLRWFAADLLEDGSFDEAMTGCKFVIHTACPVIIGVPKAQAYEKLIGPAVRGTQNVLRSVNRAGSVEKVVMTSSEAAVFGDAPPGHTFTEADFNTACLRVGSAYGMAKTLSEWQAWAIAGQQNRWRLVTLCPGVVLGPPVVPNYKSESVLEVKKLVDGTHWPYAPPTGHATVDIDDVAAAHTLAMCIPEAHGRYLLAERGADIPTWAAMLRGMYPSRWVPRKVLPNWLVMAVLRLRGDEGGIQWVKAEYHKHKVDCSKAQKQLGLSFIPLERSLRDLVDRMVEDGVLPVQPAGTANEAVAKTD
ncbi:hypothetical protein ABPG75_002713 [Micractinium tetrahymenae]